ncbi:uncharacterized protein LOC117051730 isoform X2 [Lacerta agilis]|uniref:uncharacterized protein LOC117051730 isoform X2 n=1 Tax=Lacerta agilis TaxID=80427 RepID=UPI0014195C17|nr:uncharacterized protein LOC117051730 isoform X2 [Lacerta agilis]
MKFFVLTLALAVLTGTWASVLRDEPNSKLEKLIEQWKEDWENVSRTAEGKLDLIERSEAGREFSDLIKSGFRDIGMRLYTLKEELPAEVMETLQMFYDVPYEAASNAGNALFALQGYGRRDLEELGKALLSALAGNVDPVLERVGPYAGTVHSAVVARAQEISLKMDEKIPQQIETLKAQLEPHIKKFQEFQASHKPYLDHAQELLKKGVEKIHEHFMKPYVTPVLEMYQKVKPDLRA